MDSSHSRAAHLVTHSRANELVSVLESLIPRVHAAVEQCGLYVLLSALWGLVLFLVISTTLV